MEVEIPKRIEAAAKRAQEKVALAESRGKSDQPLYDPFHRGAVYNPVEKRVEPNRTDGYGGYFIPPLWLPEQYIPGLRAHLVAAGLCRQLDLPAGTDSINIPKLSTLTSVGYQTGRRRRRRDSGLDRHLRPGQRQDGGRPVRRCPPAPRAEPRTASPTR